MYEYQINVKIKPCISPEMTAWPNVSACSPMASGNTEINQKFQKQKSLFFWNIVYKKYKYYMYLIHILSTCNITWNHFGNKLYYYKSKIRRLEKLMMWHYLIPGFSQLTQTMEIGILMSQLVLVLIPLSRIQPNWTFTW